MSKKTANMQIYAIKQKICKLKKKDAKFEPY